VELISNAVLPTRALASTQTMVALLTLASLIGATLAA